MKKEIFLVILFLIIAKSNAQLHLTEKSAINLCDDFFNLNRIITLCDFGLDYEKAKNELRKIKNKDSENYIIGKSILLYNTEGIIKSFEFIERQRLDIDKESYIKALVSLVTRNDDDFHWYKEKLTDKYLILNLIIRSVYFKIISIQPLEEKRNIANQIDRFLLNNPVISDRDRLFLLLSKIDLLYPPYFEEDKRNSELEISIKNTGNTLILGI